MSLDTAFQLRRRSPGPVESPTLLEELAACAASCQACADACSSAGVSTRVATCVQLDLVCADICRTTSMLLTRAGTKRQGLVRLAVELCATACETCAAQVAGTRPERCACAVVRHRCATACRDYLT